MKSTVSRPAQGRILALDLGERRIGLALSDELRLTAQGLPTLVRTNLREDLSRLSEVAAERGVTLFLIGNPVRMSGSEGAQSAWVRRFAEKLESRSGLAVQLWDERLTTVEAERVLLESGISRDKRRRAVDRLAAVILLQSYLEATAARLPGDLAE
jgi:putative Holliday junction resolvase